MKEESGLTRFKLLQESIFDLDVHGIPESKKGIPAHVHYDIRMFFEADEKEPINFDKEESNEMAWMKMVEISELENESIEQMVRKRTLRPV